MALHITLRKCIVSRASTLLEYKPFILRSSYSTDSENFRPIERPDLSAVSRGTGYRSSFNGIVCTVFGTSGFIGDHLVHRLGRTGTQVVVAYRGGHYDVFPQKVAGDLGQILFSHFHLRDEESIRKAVKYSDVVVNCIGQDCDSWNFKLEEVHTDGPRRIAKICREMGVKKFIHISAMGASPHPKEIIVRGGSRWLKSKWHGEQAVREEFPDAIIVRPSDVFGELDRFFNYYGIAPRLLERTLYLHASGEETIKQPVYVEDVAEGLTELVLRPAREVNGKTYQFLGPRRFYLSDLCDYMYKIMWKDEEWGYKRLDSRISFEFNAYLRVRNLFYLVKPGIGITIERFEREHSTDEVDKDLPTLADLGVKLGSIDRYCIGLLRQHNCYPDYVDDVQERIFPDLPAAADR